MIDIMGSAEELLEREEETVRPVERTKDNTIRETEDEILGSRVEPIHDTPKELLNQRRRLSKQRRSYEPIATGFLATCVFSMGSLAFPNPVKAVAISSNAVPAYAGWKIHKANKQQEEIDEELRNWWLFEGEYDLGEVLEASEPTRGFDGSDEMLESYETVLDYLEELRSELDRDVTTDIAHEDFLEDSINGLQALRIEEDDFGGYEFQLNVYLGDEEIGTYYGNTADDNVIQEVKEDGLNAEKNQDLIREYFS